MDVAVPEKIKKIIFNFTKKIRIYWGFFFVKTIYFEEGHFTNGCWGNTFFFGLKPNLFHGNNFIGFLVFALEISKLFLISRKKYITNIVVFFMIKCFVKISLVNFKNISRFLFYSTGSHFQSREYIFYRRMDSWNFLFFKFLQVQNIKI